MSFYVSEGCSSRLLENKCQVEEKNLVNDVKFYFISLN